MNKKLTILLILLSLLVIGYIMYLQEKRTDSEEIYLQEKQIDDEDWFEEFLTEREQEEEEKLKPICDQGMIPAEYASDCYFRELKDCESASGKMIPKSELEKCLPVFLKEEIENATF